LTGAELLLELFFVPEFLLPEATEAGLAGLDGGGCRRTPDEGPICGWSIREGGGM